MAEKKRKKKGIINDESTYQLIQRYSATTIVTLLQEVYQFADVKIDWKAIVKASATGISNPREYQLLWRHLAYCDPLLDNVDKTEPMDDDSDLEFELEAEPAVSAEVSRQAAASVKVLMASYLQSDSGTTKDSTGKGRITLDRSNGQVSSSAADKEKTSHSASGKNITPVSLHKQAVSTGTFAEGLVGNEAADPTSAAKKKRKLWSEEEDAELIAAVQKYGEGNWAIILKGDFKHDRTAAQLSQRWSILKKRTNPGGSRSLSSTTQSELLLATREAVESAFKMPMARSSPTTHTGVALSTTQSNTSKLPTSISEASPAPVSRPQASNPVLPPSQKEASTPLNKSQTAPKTTVASAKPPVGPNALIQAAAFAAGGRIATPSTAATLLKAAQSKKVHIMHGGSMLMSASKSRPQPNYRQTWPFTMPPSPGSSSVASAEVKVGSHQPQNSLPMAARTNCTNAEGNAEKIEGDAVVNQDQAKASSYASENDCNAKKVVDNLEAEKEKS